MGIGKELGHLRRAPTQMNAKGKIECRETMLEGIENVPAAFAGLFHGQNTGKMLVRVGPDE